MKKQSFKITFCGLMIALSMILMLLTFLPNFTYTLPALAGVCLVIVVIEINLKYALISYAVVALLSMITIPDKFAVLLYISLFGYYPITKALYEKIKNPILSWIIKFLNFNIVVVAAYFLATLLLQLQDNKLIAYTKGPFGLAILLGANVVFFLYDLAIDNVIGFYYNRLHRHVKSLFQ